MLEAKKLPACIANLDTALAEMEAENFTHFVKYKGEENLGAKSNERSSKEPELG
jgi:hypothetical protein